jgi:hypothetical protein
LNWEKVRWRPWWGIFAVWLTSRLWVALWVYAGHLSHPYRAPVESGFAGVDNLWLNPWTTYDSYWYLRIAQKGFEPLSAGFFPFYSLLLRLAGPNEIKMTAWGVLISNLSLGAGLVALFRLTKLDFGEKTAWGAVVLTAFFPLSAIFSAVYTESLFFALLVAAFLFFREKRWAWAIAAGFLAGLTRNSGPVLCLALLLEWERIPRGETKNRILALGAALAPLLGFLTVQAYLFWQFQGLGATKTQEIYGRHLNWPWLPIWRESLGIAMGRTLDITTILNFLVTLSALIFIVRGWKRERASGTALLAGIMLAQLTLGRVSPPYTNSSLRFLMTTFPFAQRLSQVAGPLTRNRLRLTLSLVILLLINALMSFLIGQKQFVMG